jgi:hypothetical protein
MTTWTSEELDAIGAAEELQLASVRSDGTPRRPVTMWVVRHDDRLYVRSVYGRGSPWFRGAQTRHEAYIRAGGIATDVRLVETEDLGDEIDSAYRAKYQRYAESIVGTTVTPQARAATLELLPR